MKKILLVLVLIVLVLGVVACDTKDDTHIDDEKELTYVVANTHTFNVGKIQKVSSPTAYLYYEEVSVGNYELRVASLLELDLGEPITVLTIDLSYGFSYNVIRLENDNLDTSLHKYLDRI